MLVIYKLQRVLFLPGIEKKIPSYLSGLCVQAAGNGEGVSHVFGDSEC